jgi:hypothetical protein
MVLLPMTSPSQRRFAYTNAVHSAESGSSNSMRSLVLRADIATNDPVMNPMLDRPVRRFGCGCIKAVSAQVAAKTAQITVLNLAIVVRVLFALVVFWSVVSFSIRISPFTFHPGSRNGCPGEILISYQEPNLKKGSGRKSGLVDWHMSLSIRRGLERDAKRSDRLAGRSIFLLPRSHTVATEDRTVTIAVPQQ